MSIEADAPATSKQIDDLITKFRQSQAEMQEKITQLQQDVAVGQDNAT